MVIAVRLLLALVGGVTGYELAGAFIPKEGYHAPYWLLTLACVLVGIGLGFLIGGFLGRATTRLGRRLDHGSARLTGSGLIFTSAGLIIGLEIGRAHV
jgi:uncharacterized protein YacL